MNVPAVVCDDVVKRFGSTIAVDGIHLVVRAGEIVSLLGPSGCGKTTFLRLIAGFEAPDAGSITIDGTTVAGDDAWVRAEKRRVGFVFQDNALFPHMTVAENVGFGVARGARGERVPAVLAMVGLDEHAARYPHELSGGQQQRVALARALAPEPALILLDEPFSDLDADLRRRVRTEVAQILRSARATAIFVTHDQDEAFEVADRIAVMRAGAIEQTGRPEEVYHVPATRAVADFVGEATFLPATVRDGVLRFELGSFPLGDAEEIPADVEVMLRPEDIALDADASGDASVLARRFQGPVTITTVTLATGRVVDAAHSSQTLFSPGERVRVTFRPDHLVLFHGEVRVGWVRARPHTGTDRG